jgi:four helix bundle protein
MEFAESFEDLVVYRKTRELARQLFRESRAFPREEMYSLTDQLRRASRSIGGQIAEAWAKRKYEKHFVSKLSDADGELLETRHWIGEAQDCGYLDESIARAHKATIVEIGRMLNAMMDKSSLFCAPHGRVCEETALTAPCPSSPP